MIIEAFHGTKLENVTQILHQGFRISQSEDDWLGYGVYFFVDGVSCPYRSAYEWALNKYNDSTAVLRTTIDVDPHYVLDLRETRNLRRYSEVRKEVISSHEKLLQDRRDLSIKKRKDIRVDDQIITNIIHKKLGIKVIIHNTYIKDKAQRALMLESSYPNSTACCVSDTSLISTIELIGSH